MYNRHVETQSFSKAREADPGWGPLDPDRSYDYNDRIRTLLTMLASKNKSDVIESGHRERSLDRSTKASRSPTANTGSSMAVSNPS